MNMTQDTALTIMKTGANVFLTGEPGSGKTHTVNAYIRYLREHNIQPSITASTGIAATHVSGMTIHSWSGIGIRRSLSEYDLDALSMNEGLVKRIANAKVLIIDEISMLDGSILVMLEQVTRTLRHRDEPFGGLQMIFVGDFFQLPPIANRGERAQFCFESIAWRSANPIVCYLSEQHRQEDTAFLSTLGAIRRGELEDSVFEYLGERRVLPGEHPEGIPQLYTHNLDVDKKNLEELAKIESEERIFLMHTKGTSTRVEQLIKGCLSPEELVLKEGASVMFTKNSFDSGYVNGTLGTIIGFDEDSGFPIVETSSGDTITALPSEWAVDDSGKVLATITQVPLRLAWAITVHKSQGMSLDAATMDLSRAFEYGQGYVALSRVRTFSGLHILGINQRAFEVHPLVLERDQAFRERSDEAETGFLDMPPEDIQKLHENFLLASGGNLEAKVVASERAAPKPSTYEETLALLLEGKTLREIATLRERTEGTIVEHFEELARLAKLPELDVVRVGGLAAQAVTEIREAIDAVGSEFLKPLFERLDERYPYETLRLVRLASGIPPKPKVKGEGSTQVAKVPSVKPEKMGARWDKDEEERLTQLFQSGMKTKAIAAELKRLPGGIRSRLKKLGLITP